MLNQQRAATCYSSSYIHSLSGDPWQRPGLVLYGEKEWYFISPRDRKYPNSSRPNRTVGTGYWKATATDKPIGSPKTVEIEKALVFYSGKAPKGVKTNWIMHEYLPANVDRSIGWQKEQFKGEKKEEWAKAHFHSFFFLKEGWAASTSSITIGAIAHHSTSSFHRCSPTSSTRSAVISQQPTTLTHHQQRASPFNTIHRSSSPSERRDFLGFRLAIDFEGGIKR